MDKRAISRKISKARVELLQEFPFFGRLLLKLGYGLAECGTAFTDMRRIVFDPLFAEGLSLTEMKYVLLHEVMHCALKHCTRGNGKEPYIYNVACDIVVNSAILEMYHLKSIVIEKEDLLHRAPDGSEGREHTAEEVYAMLMRCSPAELAVFYRDAGLDNHDGWKELSDLSLEDLWNHHLKEAVKCSGAGSGIPQFMERHLEEIDHSPHTNWRRILHEFIQFSKGDYDFTRPDRRYQSDVILPFFCENVDGCKVEKIWFFVDTSGSVSDKAVSVAYEEIKQAACQIDHLSGMLFFFNDTVSEPAPFESLDDILAIKPVGVGGTNFGAIFEKLREVADKEDRPNVMVILTDGYAAFPEEQAALGVPVIWMIVDSDVIPSFGEYAFIRTEKGGTK